MFVFSDSTEYVVGYSDVEGRVVATGHDVWRVCFEHGFVLWLLIVYAVDSSLRFAPFRMTNALRFAPFRMTNAPSFATPLTSLMAEGSE